MLGPAAQDGTGWARTSLEKLSTATMMYWFPARVFGNGPM
jgi:hypothetical protein